MGLLRGLNVNCLKQCLAHIKYSIYVYKYFIITSIEQNGFDFSTNHLPCNVIPIVSKIRYGQPKRQILTCSFRNID